ncbi:hypothetical protein GA0061105_101780 [Rhizobium aethiopicum]|uniref:Uncharacterized protein n=1 Tax=Rhizobium aethiopicum TaxID=1138170 RepID=A0A1C3XXG7_9HYPH|nr:MULTISPECIES: hypothetical protein [Rhizobium]SCB56938.1 hypothetical protein GA0061105_101780 [Rhizobium aethiopicum]
MKHRRSIGVAPPDRHAVEIEKTTLATLAEWFVIYARCHACRHQTFIDRRDIARRCGHDLSLANLARRLRCHECGNRSGNLLLLQMLPRD